MGLTRVGGSKLKEALTKLGLKTYHMKDGVMDTPGHMELWSEHAAKMMQGESGKASANAIMDKMAEDDGRHLSAPVPRRQGHSHGPRQRGVGHLNRADDRPQL